MCINTILNCVKFSIIECTSIVLNSAVSQSLLQFSLVELVAISYILAIQCIVFNISSTALWSNCVITNSYSLWYEVVLVSSSNLSSITHQSRSYLTAESINVTTICRLLNIEDNSLITVFCTSESLPILRNNFTECISLDITCQCVCQLDIDVRILSLSITNVTYITRNCYRI